MASAVKISFHKRLFLELIAFSWAIVGCVIGFQYFREKEYKSEFLNAQLQQYNRHLLEVIEEGEDYENYIATHYKPFPELRISVIALSGAVVFDNAVPLNSLNNHRHRPEIADALSQGSGHHIGRLSESDGREYFYSATLGNRAIVRTAIPYSGALHELLEADLSFLAVIISISLAMSIVAYFTTRKLGKDIERVNRYEAEQEKTILKRQLTNNINHELKTPVASIGVCLETLLSGIRLSDEKRQELLERCYTHTERLRRLLADVSLITRMEDGSQLIGKERVEINQIIKEIAADLAILPPGERLELHAQLPQPTYIEGNLALVGSIFRNLTENAIAHSGGKNIYLTVTEKSADLYSVCFEDDGRGVDAKQLTRLFERFYRVDSGRSRRCGGTGLGLAIVKHAVQFHGGTIHATLRPGGGLRFVFTLKRT